MQQQDIPPSIRKYLAAYQMEALTPAWLELKKGSDRIISVGGSWHQYFEKKPEHHVLDDCEILQGMLPIQEDFELPHMQLKHGQYTDILAFQHDTADWLLFLNVTDHVLQLQKYQQVANELHLLKDQLHRTLGRYVGNEVASRASNGDLTFKQDGERREITTLFVDIRGFTPFNESHDAQEVMNTLNQYMDGMVTPILEKCGLIDKIMGDGAMAVFGIIPSDTNTADNAFQAAQYIQQNIKKVRRKRTQSGLPVLGVGIGIATGDAVLGILGSHERRAFTAIGKHVNLAARLESSARAGEILMDQPTLTALTTKPNCQQSTLNLKGIGQTTVYTVASAY